MVEQISNKNNLSSLIELALKKRPISMISLINKSQNFESKYYKNLDTKDYSNLIKYYEEKLEISEERINELLKTIEKDREFLNEKEKFFSKNEEIIYEHKKLKKHCKLKNYKKTITGNNKVCSNEICIDNFLELINIRKKYDLLFKDYEILNSKYNLAMKNQKKLIKNEDEN